MLRNSMPVQQLTLLRGQLVHCSSQVPKSNILNLILAHPSTFNRRTSGLQGAVYDVRLNLIVLLVK